MTDRTLYDVLGVAASATASEIKTAYRLLAMKSHPAHGRGLEASEQFARVSEAYSVLSDTEGRRQYDERLRITSGPRHGPPEQISQARAERMFAKEMSALAWELSDSGYGKEFIEQALAEEGCPVALAAAAARGTDLAAGESREQQAFVRPQFAGQRPEQPPETFTDASPHTPPRASRTRWLLAGAALFVCLLVYSFAYRPYVAAKEEEARRIVAERELAAATAAKLEAEERARAAEEAARIAEQRREERLRADEAEARRARQAEYKACLARLVPAPQPPPPAAAPPAAKISPGIAAAEYDRQRGFASSGDTARGAEVRAAIAAASRSTGEYAAAMARVAAARDRQATEKVNAELRMKAEEVCQGMLRR